VIAYVEQEFGGIYSLTNIYRILNQLGFSWITSRSKHPKQSQEAQDEARFGQQNTTTRLWASKGIRPLVVKQQQLTYDYLFGAFCPSTGATEAIIAPFVDMNIMREHLSLISKRTQVGRHGVIIVDVPA
jgi:hypothetical protein